MRIGTSLVLIAVGLVLAYAVEDDVDLAILDLRALGAILFFVGLLGLAISAALLELDARRRRPARAARVEKPARSRVDRAPVEDPYDPIQPLPEASPPAPGAGDAPTSLQPRPRPRHPRP